jgi:hypothetical protein
MIHLERVALPQGLRAVAYRDQRGDLVIYVSETLDAARQRAAVVEAIRAWRRGVWRHGGLPSAGIVLLLGIRTVLWRAAGAIKARPVAWGVAATTAVAGASAAAVFITAVPNHSGSPQSASRPPPSAVQPLAPQGQRPGHAGHLVHARAAAAASTSPGPGQATATRQSHPAPTSSGGSPAASAPAPSAPPSPTPTPTPTRPAPAPSPSSSGGICVVLLGLRVCLR